VAAAASASAATITPLAVALTTDAALASPDCTGPVSMTGSTSSRPDADASWPWAPASALPPRPRLPLRRRVGCNPSSAAWSALAGDSLSWFSMAGLARRAGSALSARAG
jgi:hypothetical protein